MTVEISLDPQSRTIGVRGRFAPGFHPSNPKHFYFDVSEATKGVRTEIEDVELRRDGSLVHQKRLVPFEYLADEPFDEFSYRIRCSGIRSAYTTWLDEKGAMLSLADLLPRAATGGKTVSADIQFDLPENWRIYTSEKPDNPGSKIMAADAARGLIFAGKDLRYRSIKVKRSDIRILTDGARKFTDEDAAEMAAQIFNAYLEIFGDVPGRSVLITVLAKPGDAINGSWEAETRGTTVTILSSDTAFRTRTLQMLHEQLRHEIFHLWIPNAVYLTGDYAVYYEGAALYLSLKMATRIGQIRFEDMLDTLKRARAIDSSSRPGPFVGGGRSPTELYARGMLTAFVVDVSLLESSNGKQGFEKIARSIFEHYRTHRSERSGSEAFAEAIGLPRITMVNIDRGEPFDWANFLEYAGLEEISDKGGKQLRVLPKLNARQRTLLDELGYNGWRNSNVKQ